MMDDYRAGIIKNQITGGLAERVCHKHFELLGYSVEPFGIEHTAPYYSYLKRLPEAEDLKNWGKFDELFTYFPDYIISRTDNNKKREAYLVEVKYRSSFCEDSLNEDWDKYKNFTNNPFYMYVVTREYPHIHVRTSLEKKATWYEVTNVQLVGYHNLQGTKNYMRNFMYAYAKVIKPMLEEIFHGESEEPNLLLAELDEQYAVGTANQKKSILEPNK